MNDDWRIRATLDERLLAPPSWATCSTSGDVDHDLATAAGDRVVVSVDDHELFLYASSSRAGGARRRGAQAKLAADRGWEITVGAAPLASRRRGVGGSGRAAAVDRRGRSSRSTPS